MKTSVFKKATALVLILMMMFSMVVTAVSATDAATLTIDVEDKEYKSGDEVTVTVSASALNAQALGLLFTYDDAVFETESGNWTVEGTVMKDYDVAGKAGVITFGEAEAKDIEGAIFTLVLTVKAGVEGGSYVINVTPMAKAVGGDAVDCAAAEATVVIANAACDHTNLGDWESDGENHWKTCECGETFEKATHEFDNDCDAICDTCKYERTVGDHTYGDYEYDEVGHWKECVSCGTSTEVAPHEFDDDCDPDCACGYTRDIEHNYETKFDANGHWTECECGEKTEATAHVFGEWVIDTAATDAVNGAKHRDCACGYTESKIVPRKLKMNTVTLTLANSIAANFRANADHFTTYGYTDPFMKIVRGDKTEEIPLNYIDTEKGRRIFTIGITPQLLNDEFEYYLCAYYDGELYISDTKTYKIANYCYSQLGKAATSAAEKTLYVDLLNYATALQVQKGHNIENLANADLTDAQKLLGSKLKYAKADYADHQNTEYVVIANPTARFTSVSLRLDETVEVKLAVQFPDSELSKYKVVATNGMTTWEILSDAFEATATANRYSFYFSGLAAHQMDDVIEYTVYEITDDGDVAISNTLTYSVETYVNKNIEKSSTPAKVRDVYATMMAYGYAAQNAK